MWWRWSHKSFQPNMMMSLAIIMTMRSNNALVLCTTKRIGCTYSGFSLHWVLSPTCTCLFVGFVSCLDLSQTCTLLFARSICLVNQSNWLQCPITLECWTTLFNWNGMPENWTTLPFVFSKAWLPFKSLKAQVTSIFERGRQFVVGAVAFDGC